MPVADWVLKSFGDIFCVGTLSLLIISLSIELDLLCVEHDVLFVEISLTVVSSNQSKCVSSLVVFALAVQELWGFREHQDNYSSCACDESQVGPLKPLNAPTQVLEIESANN